MTTSLLPGVESEFRRAVPRVRFCSLRVYCRRDESLAVRQDVPEPLYRSENVGAMITVFDRGGMGYAATSDITPEGLRRAMERAVEWARLTAGRCVVDSDLIAMPEPTGEYQGPDKVPWTSSSLRDKLDLLMEQSRRLKAADAIVDWAAGLWHSEIETLYLTGGGGRVHQSFHLTGPSLRATAARGARSQTRTFGGHAFCQQGGLEVLETFGFGSAAERISAEALQLLDAPDCPQGRMDLLLAPDQMVLQIHESIGHPLEMDRILGDERNFAGTSFVTLDMLGNYRYGSDLLNVAFDPTRPEQLASYGWDDEGARAQKVYLIRNGLLLRAMGGVISQTRSGRSGTANSRADTWNRPPIDRMANLNLEPGAGTLEDMIASVERGVYMETNNSWSIDDSRNKFQFGCEFGRLIEDGELKGVVKNPNYRGISAVFWRSLRAVGDASTMKVMGTPNCGKGEPNQIMFVAHASPACLFSDVEVFGGA